MQSPYLEITYRHGRALAAYDHLRARPAGTVARSRSLGHGLVVDLGPDGRPLGVEIAAPASLTVEAFNEALASLGLAPVGAAELAPLHAA